jgi:hypothetical protein
LGWLCKVSALCRTVTVFPSLRGLIRGDMQG